MLSLKAKMAGNEEVYDGLNAFSKLMQGEDIPKEIKIKVKEELEIVEFYLYLQKSRYQDKLSYEVKMEDEKIGEDLMPLLLSLWWKMQFHMVWNQRVKKEICRFFKCKGHALHLGKR
ncbi:MAG: histidine kinase [Blautia sp.]